MKRQREQSHKREIRRNGGKEGKMKVTEKKKTKEGAKGETGYGSAMKRQREQSQKREIRRNGGKEGKWKHGVKREQSEREKQKKKMAMKRS
jgi:hypothetical protein